MPTKIACLHAVLIAAFVVFSGADKVCAQSDSRFTHSQTSAIRNQNNTSRHTSQRFSNQIYQRAVPRFNFSQANSSLLRGPASKPFANASTRPTISPYLGLSSRFGGINDYFTQVRPQLEQQRKNQQQQKVNQRQMQQNIALQHQLNQMAAQPPYDVHGTDAYAPTGHAAVFQESGGMHMNTGGFFPPMQGGRRR